MEKALLFGRAQTVKKPRGCVEGPQPFDFQSAACGVYAGEERKNSASYINLRP